MSPFQSVVRDPNKSAPGGTTAEMKDEAMPKKDAHNLNPI